MEQGGGAGSVKKLEDQDDAKENADAADFDNLIRDLVRFLVESFRADTPILDGAGDLVEDPAARCKFRMDTISAWTTALSKVKNAVMHPTALHAAAAAAAFQFAEEKTNVAFRNGLIVGSSVKTLVDKAVAAVNKIRRGQAGDAAGWLAQKVPASELGVIPINMADASPRGYKYYWDRVNGPEGRGHADVIAALGPP